MTSQYGQDAFVLEALGHLRGGFFLDSGAADGVTSSNTWLLEQRFGWTGICVEPNAALFAELRRARRCTCVNLCLYDRDGTVEFVEDARMLGGVLADYHPAHLEYAKSTLSLPEDADGHPRTVVKPARTIRGLLRELHAPEVIDYWSLDTEGSELRLLKAFPFDSYACRVITVEHNHLPDRDRIRRFLLERGYALARTLAIDDCYVARSGELRPAWRSRAWGGALGTVRLRAGRS